MSPGSSKHVAGNSRFFTLPPSVLGFGMTSLLSFGISGRLDGLPASSHLGAVMALANWFFRFFNFFLNVMSFRTLPLARG